MSMTAKSECYAKIVELQPQLKLKTITISKEWTAYHSIQNILFLENIFLEKKEKKN